MESANIIIDDPTDPYSAWTGDWNDQIRPSIIDDCENLAQTLDMAVESWPDLETFGTRRIREKIKVTSNGHSMIKKSLSDDIDYMTFKEIQVIVEDLAKGLMSIGVQSHERVTIFMETRREFILMVYAIWKIRGICCTLFANLGLDGLHFGLEELESNILVTSNDLLPKLSKLPLRHVKTIIVTQDIVDGKVEELNIKDIPGIEIMPFSQLRQQGSYCGIDLRQRQDSILPADHSFIMYTSGSTGRPKGVVMSHRSIIGALKSMHVIYSVGFGDRYVSSLPMAHIYELVVTSAFMAGGVKVIFGSALTIARGGVGLVNGMTPDFELVKPTVITAVPLMLDRIKKYVQHCIKNDKDGLMIAKSILGGQVKLMSSGAAPIPADTFTFMESFFGVKFIFGWAMTESVAAGAATKYTMESIPEVVGIPMYGCRVKLIDWEEGGYYPTDKPNPRGELVVAGYISDGYFKRPELTEETFFTDENGCRWVKTGDIGERLPSGHLKIIDRKKDLVKLPNGEYISYGKIESILKTCQLVDNVCVLNRTGYHFVVAIIQPNISYLRLMADGLGVGDQNISEIIRDDRIVEKSLQLIREVAQEAGLAAVEIPAKVLLTVYPWTPDTDMVTAALKIRRNIINIHYKNELDGLFRED